MSLQARLDRIREGFENQAPPEALAIMHRVTHDLKNSNIMKNVIGEDQKAPDFTLRNSLGVATDLAKLRAKGPVILTFFRGNW